MNLTGALARNLPEVTSQALMSCSSLPSTTMSRFDVDEKATATTERCRMLMPRM